MCKINSLQKFFPFGEVRRGFLSLIIAGAMCAPVSVSAQAPNIQWKKNFGCSYEDNYNSVTVVSDGIVAVGYSDLYTYTYNIGDWKGITGNGGRDAIIVKYDNAGNVVWKKNFGGSDGDCYKSVTSTSDGIVAVGYSEAYSFNTGDWTGITAKGVGDAIIVKYDNAGNILWKKNFGGNSYDYYNSVTAVSDGIVAAGDASAYSFNTGDWTGITGKGYDYDATIVKYDNTGNVVWKKNFGGSGYDEFYSVTAVSDGIAAVGYSEKNSFNNGDWTGVTGKGYTDAIIVKYK